MSRNDVSLSEAIEYCLNNDLILIYQNKYYLSREEDLYCFQDLDLDDEEENIYFSFEDMFNVLKDNLKNFKDEILKSAKDLKYSSDCAKKYLSFLIKLGFKISSKIELSLDKKGDNYNVEYLGYSFLPDEKKGMTNKSYESLALAVDKFEKIHNSFLESVKVC